MPEPERWKPVPRYRTTYLVSSLGRVMRIAPGRGARIGHVLRPSTNRVTGYLTVMLSAFGKLETFYIHRLVADAFCGLPLDGEVHHLDNDKSNNALSNLRIVTRSENMREVAGRATQY